jgi:TrmH family RNA methyltransferase
VPDVRIVLVGPKYEGNIGAVARSMTNFGFSDLCLVDPCEIGDDAYRRAKHGRHILEGARTVGSLEEAVRDCFLVAGTSGITTKGNKNYVRVPITASEFAERMDGYGEKTAVLFGPEDTGLLQEQLALCDVLVTVPSSPDYSVLNLSHAATIIMYELFGSDVSRPVPADAAEKEQIFDFFDVLLDAIDYPEHRKDGTSVMFRRMIGRSVPTKWEYNTLLGVFGDAAKLIRKK